MLIENRLIELTSLESVEKSTIITSLISSWWGTLKPVNLEKKINYWNTKVSENKKILNTVLERFLGRKTNKKKKKVIKKQKKVNNH